MSLLHTLVPLADFHDVPYYVIIARHYSPSEERRAGDEEGEDPHAEADVEGETLGAPPPRVAYGLRDGQVPVDRDGAQAAYDDDDGDVIVKLDCTLTNMGAP